jgi:hypothetical protein
MRVTHRVHVIGSLTLAAIALVAAAANAQTARRDPPPIPRGAISEWTARYHPNAFVGDSRVNSLTFVVDTNALYVASSADSLPVAVTAAVDSIFAVVAAHNAIRETATQLVEGRLRVPGGDSTPPVYIVDGARVKRVDSLRLNAIESIQLVKPVDAARAYGPDAAKSGAVVVKMDQRGPKNPAIDMSILQRLAKLGIDAERVDLSNMQWIVTNSGVFGTNPTYINVLYLKAGAP